MYWVTPGRYYVLAGSSVSVRRPGLNPVSGLNDFAGLSVSPTYYPNAADLSGATTIDIQSGADMNAIDFELERQPRRRIRGRVIDAATGRWPSAAAIRLVTRSTIGGTTGRESPQSYNSADGTFQLSDVPPGFHEVVVEIRSPGIAAPPVALPVPPAGAGAIGIVGTTIRPRDLVTASAQTRVQVGKSDVENLVITFWYQELSWFGLLISRCGEQSPQDTPGAMIHSARPWPVATQTITAIDTLDTTHWKK